MIEEEKIEVRTKVTVLGTAISQDSRFSDTYYKNHAHYKKITKKYQKKVDKIMSNYVIAFAVACQSALLAMASLISPSSSSHSSGLSFSICFVPSRPCASFVPL